MEPCQLPRCHSHQLLSPPHLALALASPPILATAGQTCRDTRPTGPGTQTQVSTVFLVYRNKLTVQTEQPNGLLPWPGLPGRTAECFLTIRSLPGRPFHLPLL